jgi:hypothetical protein
LTAQRPRVVACFSCWFGKVLVVVFDEDLQNQIGLFQGADACLPQFPSQPILKPLPHALDPSFGLGAQSPDGLDAELFQHAPELRSRPPSGQFFFQRPAAGRALRARTRRVLWRGLFFNFNGTAGILRREMIQDAGGWEHDTLMEDSGLSYRAQLLVVALKRAVLIAVQAQGNSITIDHASKLSKVPDGVFVFKLKPGGQQFTRGVVLIADQSQLRAAAFQPTSPLASVSTIIPDRALRSPAPIPIPLVGGVSAETAPQPSVGCAEPSRGQSRVLPPHTTLRSDANR